MTLAYGLVKCYFRGMVYRTELNGREWAWIEKGTAAALVVDGTNLLWRGDVGDSVPPDLAPLEVLLTLSILRRSHLTVSWTVS